MADRLKHPGDTLEGQGKLLRRGRLVAAVDYHLSVPGQTHFLINPSGNLQTDYQNYAGGFILLKPEDAEQLELTDYVLELANRHKKLVQVEKRYRRLKHQGQARVSFWVKVLKSQG